MGVIHYVALSILNCRDGHGFTYSNIDCNSQTIKTGILYGNEKAFFTKGADIYKHRVVPGLV